MDGSRLISAEEAFTRFIEGFKDDQGALKYEQALSEMAVEGLRSLVIDFHDLYAFDAELARNVLETPGDYLPKFKEAVLSKLRMRDREYAEGVREIRVRLRGLPAETPLRRIGADHIGKLVMVTGIIVRATAVRPLLMKAAFRCSFCREITYMKQMGQYMRTPAECPFCKRRRGFKLVPNESVFIDSQRITIMEFPMCQLSRQVNVELKGDIVNFARLGNRVNIIGSVGIIKRQGEGGILRIFDFILEVNNIELSDSLLKFL